MSSDNRERPDVSFVLPFRNEEKFLRATLTTLETQVLDGVRAEIILVDGMSTDGSRQIAQDYVSKSSGSLAFRLVDNPSICTPAAFNVGIRESRAPIIGLGGAHTLYPSLYLRQAVETLRSVDADVVGGGHHQFLASDPGIMSEAMSCLYQSPVGSGIAPYHRLKKPGYVDTVYGGFYRREVFSRVGLFNELLVRNQDNELNSRVTAAGFKIYYDPRLSTTYVQKTDLVSFLRRAFNFGYYHPTTWRVTPVSFKLRHAVPAVWVLYLFFLAIGTLLVDWPLWAFVPAMLYVILLLLSGIYFAIKKTACVGMITVPLFALYHLLYGLGTLTGLRVLLTPRNLAQTVA